MAASLHQRECVTSMMHLLDHVGIIDKCFNVMKCSEFEFRINKKFNQITSKGLNATEAIQSLAAKMTDVHTVKAHQRMKIEDERPLLPPPKKNLKQE